MKYQELTVNQYQKCVSRMVECLNDGINTLGHQGSELSLEEGIGLDVHNALFSHIIYNCETLEERVSCCNEVVELLNHTDNHSMIYEFAKKYLDSSIPFFLIKQSAVAIIEQVATSFDYMIKELD